jgi:hypothetical protein
MLVDTLRAGLVPFLQSSPGMGKSAIVRSIAEEFNLALIDHRLSTSAPEDLSGLPQLLDGKAVFAPFRNLFPLEDEPLPEGKAGWLLFLDEFNSASKAVQAASYKLILDRMVGQYKLHPQCVIVTCGNLMTDRALVTPLATAMQSRLVHLEMHVEFSEWLMDVALPQEFDSRIVAFLSQYPSKLHDFRPDHAEKTFCCPRTWEMLSKLIKGQPVSEEKAALYAGTITAGTATEFLQFALHISQLPKIDEILRAASTIPLPETASMKWATTALLVEHITAANLHAITTYANRMSLEFRILLFRYIVHHKDQTLRQHPAVVSALSELVRYLG